jgi:hypothetical protein
MRDGKRRVGKWTVLAILVVIVLVMYFGIIARVGLGH